jgi:hypothetical protein
MELFRALKPKQLTLKIKILLLKLKIYIVYLRNLTRLRQARFELIVYWSISLSGLPPQLVSSLEMPEYG